MSSQQLLNGSFEINESGCGINLVNDAFNDRVEYITAFGGQSEIDLLIDFCEYGKAGHEDYFIALYNYNFSDAFSFEISRPFNAQNSTGCDLLRG